MSSEVINEVTWNINVDGIITSASGYSSNVIVPGTVDSITVVGFSNQIFKNNSTIQTISIPDSVTSLPEYFFGDSNNTTLTSVTFTENSQLTTINNYAFHTCKSLSDFKFPSTVTSLNGTNQFQETAMSSITIPAGLTSIKQGSFYNMPNLTELIFAPNSNLTSMSQGYEFTNCNKLDVIINFPAQNFPNNSNFSTNCFHNIGPNPVVILSGETTNAQADTFIGDTNMTNRFSSTPQQNGVTFYKRPLTNQNVVDLYATLSIAQLYTAGATITQLLAEGATITQLLAANVNITFAQIRAAGVNISVFVAEGVSNANMLAAGFTQKEIDIEIDIVLTQIKIHTAFTISDGTNSSVFEPEFISPDNPLNTPNVFASTDAKTTTPQKWQDIQISSTGKYQIAVVGGYSLSTSHSLAAVTGNVWISTNYGETWLEKTGIDQVSGAEQSWINACVSADGSIMMVKAMGNIVYRSENGGTSWTQKTITNFTERVSTGWDGRPYYNLLMASDGEQLIIGTYNNIQTKMIISTDGGDNWADLTSLSSDYEYIIDYHMSKSGKYILVMFNNSTRPKYSDDFGATFNSITDTNLSLTTETSTTLLLYSRGVCAISDNGYAIFTDNNNQINTINLTTGTVSNNAYDGAWVTNTSSGFPWAVCISQNGQYMIVHMRQNNTYVNTMYISSDYGTTFTAADSNEFYVGYKAVTFNSSAIHSRCFATRFSDDNKYIAAIQEGDYIYVRKNTFIQGIYTPRTFAAKLTTDLGNTVIAGGDFTTTDSTPYQRLYLQFANAVTLIGMPTDIFNIPFSDFSVKANGQVNLRHVNLDADMTITTTYDTTSNTSTIPAGNHYINQFVSTIETDLVNFTLSYDETNNRIEFVGLAQDISMNITSNDTTVFDTSITEITQGANILPFITYGQPDPTLKNYSDNGITASEFVSNGYTILQLLSGSVIPDWNFDTNANHFDQSYVKGFTDVSGSVVIRNDNRLITNGDLSLGGNLTIHNYPPPYTVIQTPTNNLLTSQYLMDAGHSFNGNYGAIPTTDIDTTTKADSLTTITVTSVDMFGDMDSMNVPSNARICKYVDGGGNEIVGDWIAGLWSGTYTRMAKIRFTLVGNTVSVKWVERGLANTDQTDSDINLLSGWNNGTINTDYRHVLTNLVFTTTYTETITYPPNGTTSLLNDDMTLKSRLFMGEDISANGNVYIGGDLSVNGQFSGDFANGIIPQSAIGGDGGGIGISGNVYFADDVSFNGPTVDVNIPTLATTALIPDSDLTDYYNNNGTYYYQIPASAPLALTGVSIDSLDQIEVAGVVGMVGVNIGGPVPATNVYIYKYETDANGNAVTGNIWIFGSYLYESATVGLTRAVMIEFTLNGTTPSVQQIKRAYNTAYNGTPIDYTTTSADLHQLFNNSSIGTYNTDLNYSITGLTYKISKPQTIEVNQIEFNDGTTMTTHDDNILSGTFAGSNVVFKDSTFAQVTCLGAANVSGTSLTSDYRIKENVTELNETDTVDSLIPIQYNNSLSGNHEFGLLAHELQEIYPDLVNGEKNGDEYQRVNYNGLIGVLVKEIQNLKQRLSVLNNR